MWLLLFSYPGINFVSRVQLLSLKILFDFPFHFSSTNFNSWSLEFYLEFVCIQEEEPQKEKHWREAFKAPHMAQAGRRHEDHKPLDHTCVPWKIIICSETPGVKWQFTCLLYSSRPLRAVNTTSHWPVQKPGDDGNHHPHPRITRWDLCSFLTSLFNLFICFSPLNISHAETVESR